MHNNTLPTPVALRTLESEHHPFRFYFISLFVTCHLPLLQIVYTLKVGGPTLPTSFVAFRTSNW